MARAPDARSARYKKFPGVIDSARFCNFPYGFLFVVTHYESRLANHLVNLCY